MPNPVVFDVDDFCDKWNCLPELRRLKEVYPHFCATVFTIPRKTSRKLLEEISREPWLEVAVHGIYHDPLDEMLYMRQEYLVRAFRSLDFQIYSRGFRAPGWYTTANVIRACNDCGMWVAIHEKDRALAPSCRYGSYVCGETGPYWHAHTHDVCNNWLQKDLEKLLGAWADDTRFWTVSEAVASKAPDVHPTGNLL